MHHITKYGENLYLMKHIQQERVILVNENYHLPARLLIGTHDECLHPVIESDRPFRLPVYFLMFKELHIQHAFQWFLVHMLGQAHVKVKHRVFRPLGFQLFDNKSFEKVFLPGKKSVSLSGISSTAAFPLSFAFTVYAKEQNLFQKS